MYAEDVLVLIYPNLKNIEQVVIVDPFDKKVEFHPVSSVDELKEVLRKNLPFCYQDKEVEIHLGSAYLVEWEGLPISVLSIKTPDMIDKLLS